MKLAVTGGKGGVGKSTVAYNLGAELDGVVIDGDLGMADLPARRGPDLHDVLAGRATPLEAVSEEGAVRLLPCGRSLAGGRGADPTALADVVDAVERQYGTVVVDVPAGLRSDVGVALLAADACLLVTRPTRPAVADAVRARELARAVDTPLARVVLNRVEQSYPENRLDRLATTLEGPVTQIPDSPAVRRAQRAGLPVRAVDPDDRATVAFATLATQVKQGVG
ncbi:MinD/ParA family ATP-binding protein [Halovenus salina]|uniref:MinD/ParA family protein n=1 Tax=Halovenus salina TaxID=1510225 RepID=A0ABD5VZT3_9EURY|nr:chromosome partitioning protein ParA [Halovenus salina]